MIEIPKGGIDLLKACFLENKQEVEIKSAGRNKRNSSLYHVVIPDSYQAVRPFVIVVDTEQKGDDKDEYQQAKI